MEYAGGGWRCSFDMMGYDYMPYMDSCKISVDGIVLSGDRTAEEKMDLGDHDDRTPRWLTSAGHDLFGGDGADACLEELCRFHVSGQMKVAPEHTEGRVLRAMGKPGSLRLVMTRVICGGIRSRRRASAASISAESTAW